ncbi:MAG: N-acetylneuraminate synthase family protein [Candidatus Omnitrophica bacterium]|nr:N-acetylneuraminate synthase family protein [Candidatus Omnitrophota bacterium]
MKIGKYEINRGRTLVIAEIGGNHEGDFDRARKMVADAARAGADAVKFQVFKAENLVNRSSRVPTYSGITHDQQFARFKKMEFTPEQYRLLKKDSEQFGLLFVASVFDVEIARMMAPLLDAFKVASGDITYERLLRLLGTFKKPVLISTGASTLDEVRRAMMWVGRSKALLLHCICAYPAPYEEMYLRNIPYLSKQFKVPVGFSDHSVGTECCLAAVTLGAAIIEKHFTYDKTIPYGDHRHSVDAADLEEMVTKIRNIEKALRPVTCRTVYPAEVKARRLVRRSLVAAKTLSSGDILKTGDVIARRPLEGIPAEEESQVIGRVLRRTIREGWPIKKSDLMRRQS